MNYTDLLPLTNYQDDTEADLLCFVLDRARVAFAWKTGGLDTGQLRRQFPPSTMTLAGLIKHMAASRTGSPQLLPVGNPARRGTRRMGRRARTSIGVLR